VGRFSSYLKHQGPFARPATRAQARACPPFCRPVWAEFSPTLFIVSSFLFLPGLENSYEIIKNAKNIRPILLYS
jgi:hypothetical protein